MARSLNWVGVGKSGDRRRRHSVGLLMRSKRQTSLIRRNCSVSVTRLSSGATGVADGETFEDVVMESLRGAHRANCRLEIEDRFDEVPPSRGLSGSFRP
jgi:hypothetical protein